MQSHPMENKVWHLKNCPPFDKLSHKEIEAISSVAQLFQVSKNKIIPTAPVGEPSIFFLKRGHVQLTYTDEAGNQAVVILLGPGDVFGNIDPSDFTFGEHCRTVSDACICCISRSKFERLLEKSPSLAFQLTKISMLRINRLQIRLAEMMMRHADERLALALIDLDRQVGINQPDGRRKLSLALTHADLAKLIGTTREMVTMLLSKFRQANVIQTDKGWIYITDLEALRRITHARNT